MEGREGRRKEGKTNCPIQHVESLAYWIPKWFARFFFQFHSANPQRLSQKEAILLIGSRKNWTYFWFLFLFFWGGREVEQLLNQRCEGRNLTLCWGTSHFWTSREHFQVGLFPLFFFFSRQILSERSKCWIIVLNKSNSLWWDLTRDPQKLIWNWCYTNHSHHKISCMQMKNADFTARLLRSKWSDLQSVNAVGSLRCWAGHREETATE